MPLSQKHHYLPRFYLKGFTNEEGFFYKYDHNYGRIDKRQIHPNNIFYDDRNLVDVNGAISDIPEQMYSQVDNRHADLFARINNQQTSPLFLGWEDKLLLLEFIITTFWRLPSSDTLYQDELKNKELF